MTISSALLWCLPVAFLVSSFVCGSRAQVIGHQAIREVNTAIILTGLEDMFTRPAQVAQALSTGLKASGTPLNDEASVDSVVRLLEQGCSMSQRIKTLSTAANTEDAQYITVRCRRSGSDGYYDVRAAGRLVGVGRGEKLRYFILEESPGAVRYRWPDYGVPETEEEFDATSQPWYPVPAPVSAPHVPVWSPVAAARPICKGTLHTISSLPDPTYDSESCPRFTGVAGVAVDSTKFLAEMGVVASGVPQPGGVFATASAEGILVGVGTPAKGAANSVVAGAAVFIANTTLHGGWSPLRRPAESSVSAVTSRGAEVLSRPFDFEGLGVGNVPWFVNVVLPASRDSVDTAVEFRRTLGDRIARRFERMFDGVFSALGAVDHLIMEAETQGGAAATQFPSRLRLMSRLCRGVAAGEHFEKILSFRASRPDSSFEQVTCRRQTQVLSATEPGNPGVLRNFLFEESGIGFPESVHRSNLPEEPPDTAFDLLRSDFHAAAVPAANPSLSAVFTEPDPQTNVIALTLPRCSPKPRGPVTPFSTPLCVRFRGVVGLQVSLADVTSYLAAGADIREDLGANGFLFLVSPGGYIPNRQQVGIFEAVASLGNDLKTPRWIDGVSVSGHPSWVVLLEPPVGIGKGATIRTQKAGGLSEWRIVVVLRVSELDLRPSRLPEFFAKQTAEVVRSFAAAVRNAISWTVLGLQNTGADIRSVSTGSATDTILAAHGATCRAWPSHILHAFSASPSGTFLNVSCARTREGRLYEVQLNSSVVKQSFYLDSSPGEPGTGVYNWDWYGPVAHELPWGLQVLQNTPWYKAAEATGGEAVWTTEVVDERGGRAPPENSSAVSATMAYPHGKEGFVVVDMYLTPAELHLRNYTGPAVYLQGTVGDDGVVLLAASAGNQTSRNVQITPAESDDPKIAATAAIRNDQETSGVLPGVDGIVWVNSSRLMPLPGAPPLRYGKKNDWEAVLAFRANDFRNDHVNTLRGLTLDQIGLGQDFVFVQSAMMVNMIDIGLSFLRLDPAQEGHTDGIVSLLWSVCDTRSTAKDTFVTSADGVHMLRVDCSTTLPRAVTIKHEQQENVYQLWTAPGFNSTWPSYGSPLRTRDVGNYRQELWWRESIPSANPSLRLLLGRAFADNNLYYTPLTRPRCRQRPGVEGCGLFEGITGATLRMTELVSLLFSEQVRGLGPNGIAFLFTDDGKLLASSYGQTAPDILQPVPGTGGTSITDAAAQLRLRNVWGTFTARQAETQQFQRERGYEFMVSGHTANVDIYPLRDVAGITFTEVLYICIVLRFEDFESPQESRPPRMPLTLGAPSLNIGEAWLVLASTLVGVTLFVIL